MTRRPSTGTRRPAAVVSSIDARKPTAVGSSSGAVRPVPELRPSTEIWADRAEAALAASGRKRGGARRALLELLEEQTCALTALEIEEALRSHPRAVSRASVYRILDELERLRLVARVETGQAMIRYERARDSSEHHHHLVCDSCGLVMPFSDAALERAIDELSGRVPLAVSEHEIVLRGSCRECA